MSEINIIIEHRLPKEEMKNRLNNDISEVKKEFPDKIRELSIDWNGDEGNVKANVSGKEISGTIHITEDTMVLKGEIPILSVGFESKIEGEIRERLIRLTYDKI